VIVGALDVEAALLPDLHALDHVLHVHLLDDLFVNRILHKVSAMAAYLMVHDMCQVRVLEACLLSRFALEVLLVVDVEHLRGRGRDAARHRLLALDGLHVALEDARPRVLLVQDGPKQVHWHARVPYLRRRRHCEVQFPCHLRGGVFARGQLFLVKVRHFD